MMCFIAFCSISGIFDELYNVTIVRPSLMLGRLFWKGGDGRIIDGLGPDGISARVAGITNRIVKLQSGFVYHYAFAMLIGVAALITWFMFAGGALSYDRLSNPFHSHLPAASRCIAYTAYSR
jgi:hypothetical protein